MFGQDRAGSQPVRSGPAIPCRGRCRATTALRFPEPRAEEPAAAKPKDEIPGQPVNARCRAEVNIWMKKLDGRNRGGGRMTGKRSQTPGRNSAEPSRDDVRPRIDDGSTEPLCSGRWPRLLVDGRRRDLEPRLTEKLARVLDVPTVRSNRRRRPNRKTQRHRQPELTAFSSRNGSSRRMSNRAKRNRAVARGCSCTGRRSPAASSSTGMKKRAVVSQFDSCGPAVRPYR